MDKPFLSRRNFIGAGVSAFTIVSPELVRGAGKEKIKVGLIGCGGRGTVAAFDLLSGNENVELVAMADLFEDHLEKSLANLRDPKVKMAGVPDRSQYASIQEKIKIDPEHHFTGFDAYKKLIASDVDIVMLATPPGYRPIHFEAAVEAGKHVFTEKPIATDPTGVRRFMAAARKSEQKKLTVVSGAQRHYFSEFQDTIKKIHDGAIGESWRRIPGTWTNPYSTSTREIRSGAIWSTSTGIGTPTSGFAAIRWWNSTSITWIPSIG